MTKYKHSRKNPLPLALPALEFVVPAIIGGITYLITRKEGESTFAKPPSLDTNDFKKAVEELMEEFGDNYFVEQPKDLFYLDKPLDYINTQAMLGYSNRAKTIYIGENVGEWNRWTRNVKDVEWYLHQYTRPRSNKAFSDAIGPLNFLYFSKKKVPFAPWIGLANDVVADQDFSPNDQGEISYLFSIPQLLKGLPQNNNNVSATSEPEGYYKALRVSRDANKLKIAKMLKMPTDKAESFYRNFAPKIFDKATKRLIAFYLKFVVFKTRAYWRDRYDAFCADLDKKYELNIPFFADRYTTTFSKPSPDENNHYRLLISHILSSSPASNFDSNTPLGFDPSVYPVTLVEPTIEDLELMLKARKDEMPFVSKKMVKKEIAGFRNTYKETLFNIRKNLYPIDELRICSAAMWVLMQKFEKMNKNLQTNNPAFLFLAPTLVQDAITECFKDIGFGYIFKKIGASTFFNFVSATDRVGAVSIYQFIQTYVPEFIDYLALGFLKTTPGYTIDEKYIHFAELFLDGVFCCEVENRDSLFIDSADEEFQGTLNSDNSSFVSGAVFYKKS